MGLPSMRPTGWFQVAWSADLEVGDVKPLHYFGADLVAFRDLDGAVRVLDAHCQHLGADLSHGGCVVEGGIQCPFHGWVWSGDDGRNVRIPYEQRLTTTGGCGAGPPPNSTNASTSGTRLGIRPALAGAGHVPELSGPVGYILPPIGPERETVLRLGDGSSAGGRRKLGRPPALPVRHTVPVSPTVLAAPADNSSWQPHRVRRRRTRRNMLVWTRFELQLRGQRRRDADRLRLPDTGGRHRHRHLRDLLGVRRPRLRRPVARPNGCWPTTSRSGPTCDTSIDPALAPSEADDFQQCANGPGASIRRLSQTCAASPCRCTARAGNG